MAGPHLDHVPEKGAANGLATLDGSSEHVAAQYKDFVGDSGAGGTKGGVPAPASGDAAAGRFLSADGSWATPGTGGISLQARWQFDNATGDSDPGSGTFRMNNGTQSSATQLFISDETEDGADFRNILLNLRAGDRIYLQEEEDSTRYHVFLLNDDPVAATNYVKLPGTVEDSGADLQDGQKIAFVFLATGAGGQATEATGTSTISITSATDILATGMTLTEGVDFDGAGTYLAMFSGSVQHSGTSNTIFTSIHVNGVQVASTERRWGNGGFFAGTNIGGSFISMGLVTVAAGQAVTGEWRTSAATATMYERSLILIKVR